jgi:hypothetical protein
MQYHDQMLAARSLLSGRRGRDVGAGRETMIFRAAGGCGFSDGRPRHPAGTQTVLAWPFVMTRVVGDDENGRDAGNTEDKSGWPVAVTQA